MQRTPLSRVICEALNWRGADGRLCEMACRVTMLRLEADGLVEQPPSQIRQLRRPACFASTVLGMAARRLPADWQQRYGFAPVLLETFVESPRHKGTCYRAANVLTTATQKPSICVFIGYTREVTMRAAAINLRALPEQRDLIDHAATLLGKNRSDFMLEAACERAQSVLLDQVFFGMDAEKFQRFTALLDAPPSANVGLERLMAVKAPWDSQPK